MSGDVRLSEAERARACVMVPAASTMRGRWYDESAVEAILTARLAPVEALADWWVRQSSEDGYGLARSDCARELRAALAPQPAPGEIGG